MGNFSQVVVGDFEYEIEPGGLPNVLCMVAHVLDENLRHVRTIRLWRGEFCREPPFDIGPDTLFVAYSAWAELTCFMTLGWRFPVKDAAGKVTGDRKLQTEGKVDEAKGAAHNVVGDVKDAVRKAGE